MLHLISDCFEKRDCRLTTCRSRDAVTAIDYDIVNSRYRSRVKDKVIPGKNQQMNIVF